MRLFLALGVLAFVLTGAEWHGYEKKEVTVDGVAGYVVLPRNPAPGNPWLWRARFPEFHPEAAEGLLAKGYHVAYYDLPNIFGSPKAVESWDHFYAHVLREFGLSKKVALEGVSRGGLFVYNWAVRNPEKVESIYCESPVCDMKSWPGGKGHGQGSKADWQQALDAYGFSETQMLVYRGNPVDTLAPLAQRKVPVLHVVSEWDQVVPPAENTEVFIKRYQQAGGPAQVYFNAGGPQTLSGHHFPLDNAGMEVDFILRNTAGLQSLAGTGLTPYGVPYFKLRDGLRNSLAKFAAGGSARVVFLGGSITAMKGWRDSVCEWLKNRFPQTQFEFINAGIPSTGSTPGAFRLRRDVFGNGPVDLLFQEAAVNDSTNGYAPREQVRGVEGIVRQARLLNPSIDIVLMHFVDPEKSADYRAGRTPAVIVSHEQVAARYGLPSLDLAREVTDRIDAGEFEWKRDFVELHPSPFGQGVYFRSIVRLFQDAWRETSAGVRPYSLPDPLDEKSYFRGRLISPSTAPAATGWRLEPNWKPLDSTATRKGFVDVPMVVCETPDAELALPFSGTAIGLFVAAGPDAGVLEFRIDNGPWRQQKLFTQWSKRLHIPWAYILDADLPDGKHELRMRLKSGAVRIVHFLEN
ncbi:MAG TPA: GDSL-type esterase/lipase family protein [Bryobacteraceae bacterium]|nr:GDSL-type esterase/lipase family protein [Bryobacteraceae bacterium]